MMSAMAALVAVGGTSLVCYLLMNRVQKAQDAARERGRRHFRHRFGRQFQW
jgi:hypothetical protein